ncbi:glycerol-3-phosphate 1-O-acyltransferase PlsY [Campylobacter sp. IFREMER_LSEM_CL1846]|uniref:glycerol-3-phosphate 1-O-acyltransferase PlsY n=1 Tax=Campylobacter sp. IFREMER_LSEM_CL1846 TaxID=2911614 RepID=UPI0021E65259|nr:glycerol-3-phosphate 1-O-acyltransferase PlsY [Campylobacter sp. IFREMER_LSEM_CL1846]HEC1747712.1 glycerol-3-phosphate 1-O-acyltransferase PlsY [Campylobacter lari]MCV3434703.1 glycerol-3-phosphate 1-O-acyltransferase PlsY [Campylobacter sp. IFREMER_LSEM_CL1846]HEC1768905.1 glycerol-3-phosphate 1-O-acyltransferase PlsY [Campylobacter lari]HEC1789675.1 glycerol-3-phosphate 1-O-acyltransferase PlsY [Campylobacter lari]HEC1796187.1 glycerol-3-phosphate 1-O-acyltransferase PlsY [Campylobacter l
MENLIIYLLAYLIGAIPFGLLLAQIFAKTNIKNMGSKSIGATNVLRVVKESDPKLAKILAIATAILDALKGIIPILVAKFMGYDENILWTMAVLAVFGHCFSPYLKFEGGKGVATGAGVLAVFLPFEIISAVLAWFIIGKVFKISSLASLGSLIVLIATSFIFHYNMPVINTHAPIFVIAFIVIYKHIPNILRLIGKQECKVI